MRSVIICFLMVFLVSSCKTGVRGFGKRSPHDQYGKRLHEAGLETAAIGRLWFQAAASALSSPVAVTLPLRQVGYFSAEKPSAIGLVFQAKRGQKLQIQVKKIPGSGFILYNEIWMLSNGEQKLELAADTSASEFNYEVDETGSYIFRMQPELLQSGEYSLTISVGPSLRFPVAGSAKIGSLWGAPRDGGARTHEGIDIFAPKRTPVIASSDGVVSRVTENNIGGKVLFLRPDGKNMSLYYAHLDEQLVESGKRVRAGDTIGLVGNTGNAKTTPPHLHFGIYASGGAIDPLAFVDPVIKKPGLLASTGRDINGYYRLTKDTKVNGIDLKKNAVVRPLARNTEFDWAELPDGSRIKISSASLQIADKPLSTLTLRDSVYLYEKPDPGSPRKQMLAEGQKIAVLGNAGTYSFVRSGDAEGWILIPSR